jgi:hypothetical protein
MTAMLFDFPTPAPAPQKKKPAKQGYTGEFLSFWELYPPRFNSSKFLAFKAWNKLDEDEQRQAMIAAPVYAARQRGKDEQFTQHAATWLNGKFFETITAPRKAVPAAPPTVDRAAAERIFHATGRWPAELGPEPTLK